MLTKRKRMTKLLLTNDIDLAASDEGNDTEVECTVESEVGSGLESRELEHVKQFHAPRGEESVDDDAITSYEAVGGDKAEDSTDSLEVGIPTVMQS